MLSRGNLTIPSPSLANLLAMALQYISTRTAAQYVLKKYSQTVRFTCKDHVEWGMHYSIKMIINIFYNNKQKISADSIQNDAGKKYNK